VALTEILPIKSNSLDMVIAIFGPLDHTVNYNKAFKEIARVLKPGGVFYFTVLNRFSLEWIMKNVKSPKLMMKTLKLSRKKYVRITLPTPKGKAYRILTHFYDKFELKKLLESNNLKMVRTRCIFSILQANFKSKKFSRVDEILSKIEIMLSDKPVIRWLGRYIEGIAVKNVKKEL
jgi:ubiquinone/menaquinone biosynthesis C-methylase UbiE